MFDIAIIPALILCTVSSGIHLRLCTISIDDGLAAIIAITTSDFRRLRQHVRAATHSREVTADVKGPLFS